MPRLAPGKAKPQGAGTAPLGNTTKSVVAKGLSACLDSEILNETSEVSNGIFTRLERYRLQAVARLILGNTHRLTQCLRLIRKGLEGFGVNVFKSTKHDRCHYGNLICCGSVWVCPVCSAKITERRRQELLKALAAWKEQGGGIAMLTLTAPHRRNQNIKKLSDCFRVATKALRGRTAWRNFLVNHDVVGSITALECTWGEVNGWHVHTHTLLFLDDPCMDIASIDTSGILKTWKLACLKSGLEEPNEHGLDLQDASRAASYVAKFGDDSEKQHVVTWGAADELTKSHVKRGRLGSLTPWDLLRMVHETGDCLFAELFKQFAVAFKGRRQLVWSPGLRDLLDFEEELTDEEIVMQQEEDAVLLGTLDLRDWEAVWKADRRGELLEVARLKGWEGVVMYVAKIKAFLVSKSN